MNRCDTAIREMRGFTLIEVLVVMLIMGLCIGLISAIVRPDDRGLLRVESMRLAQLLDLASAESRLTGKSIAWTTDGHSYTFWRMTGNDEWSEVRDSDLLRARTLPQGMRISGLQVEDMPVHGSMRLEFASYSPALAFSVDMSLGTARDEVTGSPVGEVQVLPVKGNANAGLALQ